MKEHMTTVHIHPEHQIFDIGSNDVVILQFGDPTTGWVPAMSEREAYTKEFQDILEASGRRNVKVLNWTYAVKISVIDNSSL